MYLVSDVDILCLHGSFVRPGSRGPGVHGRTINVGNPDSSLSPQMNQDSEPLMNQDSEPLMNQDAKPLMNQDSEPLMNQDSEPLMNQDGEPQADA
jgi:hypothetical protein